MEDVAAEPFSGLHAKANRGERELRRPVRLDGARQNQYDAHYS